MEIYEREQKQSRVSNVMLWLMGMHATLTKATHQKPCCHQDGDPLFKNYVGDFYCADGGVHYTSKLICKTPSNYATDAHEVHCTVGKMDS